MTDRHSLLTRQLKRTRGGSVEVPAEWRDLIEAVNDAYHQSDADRGMLERALDLSSDELLEANSELRAVVQAFPDLFFRLDSRGRILDCKAGSATDLLLPAERLKGRRIQNVPDHGASSRFRSAIQRALASQSIVSIEYSLAHPNRAEWYEARVLPLREDQLLAIVRNITDRKEAENALRQSEQEYRGLFETAHDAIIVVDPESQKVLTVNERACDVYGYTQEEFVGKSYSELVGEPRARAEFAPVDTEAGSFEAVHRHRSGTAMSMDIRTSVVRYRGEPAILSINRDITAREEAKRQLESSVSLLQATFDSTADGILVVDDEGAVVASNRRFSEMWCIPEALIESGDDAQMLAFAVGQLKDPDTFMAKVRELYSQPEKTSYDVLEFADGRVFERYSQAQKVGGICVGRVWSFRDITTQHEAQAAVHRLAYYDELTQLPNRVLLRERLEPALAEARRNSRTIALLFLDLDQFKTINDTLGHARGDLLLSAVADRLRSCCREGETLARLGGDEFVLMTQDLQQPEDASVVATRLLAALEAPFVIDGRPLHVTSSVGISVYPFDGDDAETLLTKADVAMYAAKARGRGIFQFYEPEMDARALEKLTLENDLRRALRQGEFIIHYQPQVELGQGAVVAAEALVRWRKPDGTLVPPGDFIPVAERSGLIVPLGDHVLSSACRQARSWRDAGHPPIRLAVNVSARQLERRDFVPRVAEILEETGFEATLLELELTESAILLDPDRAAETLSKLRELGIGIALDDFGTGHSSLSKLSRLPIQTLKMDRSFVRSCHRDAGNRAIVTAILAMARSLGMRVVAEGVETAAELCFLRDEGCSEIQGYHVSPPVAPERFVEISRRELSEVNPAVAARRPNAPADEAGRHVPSRTGSKGAELQLSTTVGTETAS